MARLKKYAQTADLIHKHYGDAVPEADYASMRQGKPSEAIIERLHELLRHTAGISAPARIAAQEVMRIEEARGAGWPSPG